ncbi:MAG: MATE family efflux transporter [Alphaproteobacteria bacterium]|nr:MATE family efflux transporter [Alphaproteobacteria bacterium]
MEARLPARIGHAQVFRLAWPILVSMLSYTAMTVADSIFVAQLGTTPLAALGLAATGVHLLQAFPIGLIGGARVQIAQAVGAADLPRARALAWQALYLAAGFGALSLLVLPFAGPFTLALGARGELVEHGTAYLWVRIASAPLVFAMFALQAWYQGRGDTRTPMVAVLAANAVNIGLDPFLIFGWSGLPALGVEGAALATAVALVVQVLVLIAPAVRPLWPHRVGVQRELAARIWRTGLPMGTGYVLDVLSFVVFTSLLAHVGDAHLAAHVIVVRIVMVSFLPGHAIGEAAGVLVGQSIGAGRPEAARQAWWSASQQALALMLSLGAVFLLLPAPLVGIFRAEPEVAAIAIEVLGLAALVQVFDAIAMVGLGSLNGAGDTRFTMGLGLLVTWFGKVPVSMLGVLALGWGAYGAWLGIVVDVMLVSAIALLRIQGSGWLGHAQEDAVPATAPAA